MTDIREDEAPSNDMPVGEFPIVGGAIETRSSNVSVGAVDFEHRIITMIAVPYEQPTPVVFNRDVWNEVFSRSAFDGIQSRFDNGKQPIPVTASLVIPNPDHDNGKLVGRVIDARSGVEGTEDGLIAKVFISKTRDGDETLQLANDGAVSPSVGFQIKDPSRDQRLDRYTKTRRVNRAFLHHISFVAEPAYSGARILSVRSAEDLSTANPAATPLLDAYMNDPVVQWANQLANRADS